MFGIALSIVVSAFSSVKSTWHQVLSTNVQLAQLSWLGDRPEILAQNTIRAQANRLFQLGMQQYRSEQREEARETWLEALKLYRQLGDPANEVLILTNLGVIDTSTGNYRSALENYQTALNIQKTFKQPIVIANILNLIGDAYLNLGEFPKSLVNFEEALKIFEYLESQIDESLYSDADLNMLEGKAKSLDNLGITYYELGQYDRALEFNFLALKIRENLEEWWGQSGTHLNIGRVYQRLEEFPKARYHYQQALSISRTEIQDRRREAIALNNLGSVHRKMGDYNTSIEYLQSALNLYQTLKNPFGEASTLDSLGSLHADQDEFLLAFTAYQQSLAIFYEIEQKGYVRAVLHNVGRLLENQHQDELAIAFYKQSVNLTESIRDTNKNLSREFQVSYTETVADTYRRLANLLLSQDRILEAQRVLDLLKVQELSDYLESIRGNKRTALGIPLNPQENKVFDNLADLQHQAIVLGRELAQLRKISVSDRTSAQVELIAQLVKAQNQLLGQFNSFIDSPEVVKLVDRLSRTARQQALNLEDLTALQDNLRDLEQNAALLSPLILEDRLELVLTTPYSPPVRRTTVVSRVELNRTIAAYRTSLEEPTSDPLPLAQQLYDWILKPLEADLATANTQTLIYAPDAQLRYIPLAALHDGHQWLAQRLPVTRITAASLTDLNTLPQSQPQLLAAAFTSGRYQFDIAGEPFDLSGLPFTGPEVEAIASLVPNTTQLRDRDFSPAATLPLMDDHTIVHLATHAAFVIGQPHDSFILFGNGDRVTLEDVKTWTFQNIDLVVLSACETGVGGDLGNGEEILGFGYLMQRAGARASLASLWQVSDGGTQALMAAFYASLREEGASKATALNQAQTVLIAGDAQVLESQLRGLGIEGANTIPLELVGSLSHPYYWAPFILIGNSL